MGKQWKTAGKAEAANKKGAIISKIAKEIMVATRLGGADPDTNSRLRLAIRAAKDNSVTKDTIERAIKKGSGDSDGAQIDEIMYEGFGPHQVGVLVECQTDNRNRTAPEVKLVFKQHGGHIGELGSVSWMFERVAYLSGKNAKSEIDAEEEAIMAGAQEVAKEEDGSMGFYGAPEDLASIQKSLIERGWDLDTAELSYRAKTPQGISDDQLKEVQEFLAELIDNEDTFRVHTTLPE